MSKKVILNAGREVDGKWVKPHKECLLPDGLAVSLEAKGECTIVSDGVRAPVTEDDVHEERTTPEAKAAVKVAAKTAKARADAKKPPVNTAFAKKRAAPKKKAVAKKKAAKTKGGK